MANDKQVPARQDGGENLSSQANNLHEAGKTWARTPEMRAHEGVIPSFREDESLVIDPETDLVEAADAPSSPSSFLTPAPAQPYDPYLHDRYDLHQRHLYDDYYLQEEFYHHDDYNPQLYYDYGTYPDSHQTYQAPPVLDPYHPKPSRDYGPAPHVSHPDVQPADAFIAPATAVLSSAAVASGVNLVGEHTQEALAGPNDLSFHVSESPASLLNHSEALLDIGLLHQIQNQSFVASSPEYALEQEVTPRVSSFLNETVQNPSLNQPDNVANQLTTNPEAVSRQAVSQDFSLQLPLAQPESLAQGLTVNPAYQSTSLLAGAVGVQGATGFVGQPAVSSRDNGIEAVLAGGASYSMLTPSEPVRHESVSAVAPSFIPAQHHSNGGLDSYSPALEGTLLSPGIQADHSNGPLFVPEIRPEHSDGLLAAPEKRIEFADSHDVVASEVSAAALVMSRSDTLDPQTGWFGSRGSELLKGDGKSIDVVSQSSPMAVVSSSKAPLIAAAASPVASTTGSKVRTAATAAGVFAGKAAEAGAQKTLGALGFAANQLLREDEDLARISDFNDILSDGLVNVHRFTPDSDEDMIERLISNEFSAAEAVEGNSEKAIGMHAKRPEGLSDAKLKVAKAGVREKPEAANAKELFVAMAGEKGVSAQADLLEKGPTGLKGVAASVSNEDSVGGLLLEKDDGLPKKEKKPVTKRERDIEKKKAERKAAKKEKNDSLAMSVVKQGGNAGMKGALLVGGMAASSTKKVISSRNDEIAVAVSSVDKTKKAVRGVKTAARAPIAIYRYTRQTVLAVINAVKHLFTFAATLTSMGPAGALIAFGLFFLIVVIIAILFATASIINDEQEVSEVSALVAELDAQLTEEIHEMGDQPILYLDASDTYNMKDDKNRSLTKDADLADDESDLQEVIASSVTVQTDPGAIAAYIDAKYTGNWQVGAASWKYTIDAFGETWNLIEWDDMPEWAWKGLNKVNRVDFKTTMRNELMDLLMEEYGVEELDAREIGSDTAEEFATVIYDNQVQGVNEEILTQIIKDSVRAHKGDLDLTDDEFRKLYYEMQNVIAGLIADEDPFAFVYDEIVGLHAQMNWWSDRYDTFANIANYFDGFRIPIGSGSGTNNEYGYPNSSGYDEGELANWDGFNEVSVFGISEAGTGAVTADGTRITNTWDDLTMGIACEGLQNSIFAYWSSDYKRATGVSDGQPVKITLYNPITGMSVTAQVIDCGGWRGFNPNYAGMNADRQWDLLPAVWKALGGSEEAGTMKVYWRVDPDAVVGQAALEPKSIEGYLWPKETDENDDVITITRPTLIVHGVQDALNNDTLMEKILDRDSFATDAEFEAIKTFVITKVKDVMKTLLTMENSKGDTYVDYNYVSRDLADPFGEDEQGNPREWIVTHRFNPGYDDYDEEEAYVEVKPLDDVKTVRAILEGEVEEVDDGTVTIRSYIDTANSSEVVYSELTDIKVEEGDEVKEGQKIGKMADDALRISYYEINDTALLMETRKDWSYDPGLYMIGFAGYEEPDEPKEYIGPTSDYSGCQTVVEFAYSRLGCPYVWGATGPNTFDCSGLTQWCYANAGIVIPRNSEAQHDAAAAAGNVIPLSQLQPGDILWKPGHVGIYIGNNQYIHAPRTGDVVKISTGVFYFSCGLRFG